MTFDAKVTAAFERLVSARNTRSELIAAALAFGISPMPGVDDQTGAARVLGVTRAALNKRVQYWRDTLGMRSVYMRSERTRERCRTAQLKDHWRRRGRQDGAR